MSEVKVSYTFPTGQRLEISQGDITNEAVDAVVNAANPNLQHGGGVAAAIARRGGPIIQEESDLWIEQHGPVSHAVPAYTSAGSLPARYVIHTVGPVWGTGEEDSKLAQSIRGVLLRADELHLSSVAMPAISTGIFGFPKEMAAKIFMETLSGYLETHPDTTLKLIRIVLFDSPTLEAFLDAHHDHFGA